MLLPGSAAAYRPPTSMTRGRPSDGRRLGHLVALRTATNGTATSAMLARARRGLLALVEPAPALTPNLDCCAS